MKINRREFVKQSGFAAAGTLFIPKFVRDFAFYNKPASSDKKLIIVQLSGGNDGLNTVIPYRNDDYYKLRPKISIERPKVLHLTDELGLNPAMGALRKMYDQGNVCVINNVGYPNPNRSHFRSMDIWQTASDADQYMSHGWVGRYLDSNCQTCDFYQALEIDDTLSLAMKGENMSGLAVQDPTLLYRMAKSSPYNSDFFEGGHREEPNLNYLYKTLESTLASAEYIHEKSKIYKSALTYPNTRFAKELQLIAELIISRIDTQVFYVSLGGFDTHSGQNNHQPQLLSRYAEGMSAFMDDLQKNDVLKDTLVITFSEFGRRVQENASRGTDHGKANNMFVMGGSLKEAGILNELPDLSNLDEGDLNYNIDFRQVYATALDKWLHADSKLVLGKDFKNLSFL